MTDRTHKNRINDLESDLEQKKSENAKNSAKSRKLKNELKRQTDSIASSKSQVLIRGTIFRLQINNIQYARLGIQTTHLVTSGSF